MLISPEDGWTVELSTHLAADSGTIWAHMTRMEGVNTELWPWLRMTFPPEFNTLQPRQIDPPGAYLFDSWLLVLGFLPVDRHSLSLQAMNPPTRFYEVSKSWLQRQWIHDRELFAHADGGCVLRDRVAFTPRLPVLKPLVSLVVRGLFIWRHRRLRTRFGRNNG